VIWTTTPWTLPANQAVAVHPEYAYAIWLVEREDGSRERLLVAADLAAALAQRAKLRLVQEEGRALGAALEGLTLQHPFYEREVPVILGDHVTLESGTGAVHTAPGHGQEDFAVGQKYGLAVDNPVGNDGRFLPSTPLFAASRFSRRTSTSSRCSPNAAGCCTTRRIVTAIRIAGVTRRR
jgi:isoleucyl-tRNA synthetase